MMINSNYAQQVEQAKTNNASVVNFDTTALPVQPIPGQKDTVTFSDKALAMMNGTEIKEVAPTYVRPETARELLSESEAMNAATAPNKSDDKVIDTRFGEMMQNIIDQRLGVDRKKLEELEALMAEVAENEDMSPEEKQKVLEQLAEMREKIIQEGREIQETAKQTG